VNDFAPAEISANSAAIYGSSIAMAKSEAFEHWCGCHLEMPLGIEAYGGVMMHVVPRKSRVPFKRASMYDN
jgi:molecular chaperone DnaK (HSP70)